jgi:O-antigen ligase
VAAYWAWCRFAGWELRLPRAAQAGLVGAAAIVALAGVMAFDPAAKFDDFKRAPGDTKYAEGDFTRSHLLSSTSTGRWQLWSEARDQWETKPVFGQGAGSYQSWWTEHADFSLYVRDAHNLWLEMLGELGIAGFALILVVFGAGFVAAAARLRRAGPGRPQVAALAGVLAAFVLGAAIDWMWELTIVALIAVVALGMLVGFATLPGDGEQQGRRRTARGRGDVRVRVLRTGAVAVALAAVMCVAVPMLAQERLEDSQAAADAGNLRKAMSSAEDASSLEPWAATPYVQLALLEEQAGNLSRANRHIKDALERDSRDWSTWLVAARLQTKAGSIRAGRRSLRRAEALNPTSPLFEDLRNETRGRDSG